MARALHPQLQQFLTLLILWVIGEATAHVYLGWMAVAGWLVYTAVVEHALIFSHQQVVTYFSFSALSTALGVVLMLVASPEWIYGVVLLMALVQKHWLRVESRHFFNPSNFALMMGMFLFYDRAHVVLGQMGDARWLEIVVMVLAAGILIRVARWRIPLAFVVSYLVLEYLVLVGYDPVLTFETIWERFYSVAFIIFIAFMLTDPRTTPSRPWQQVFFGMTVALLAVLLDRWHGFRVQHLFMVLFVLSPVVPILDAHMQNRTRMIMITSLLMLIAVGIVMMIESRPPFYFAMDG